MHTTEVKVETGESLVVQHNGDWSGEAFVAHYFGETLVSEIKVEDGRLIVLLALRIAGRRLEARLEGILEDLEDEVMEDAV